MLRDATIDQCLQYATDPATYNDCISNAQVSQCVNAANDVTAPLDAKTQDLAMNWIPMPTYSAAQVRTIVGSVLTMIQEAQAAVDHASAQPNANQSDLNNATDDLARHGQQALDYTQAANQADAAGISSVVAAPNMKQWVLNAMTSASNAMVAAYTVSCTTPGWVGDLAAFQVGFDSVWTVVKIIAGTVAAAGVAVVQAAETIAATAAGTFSLLTWFLKWWPLLGGALLIGGIIWKVRHRNIFLPHYRSEESEG